MKKTLGIILAFILLLICLSGCNSANATEMQITSKSALLMSADTGEVLFQHNANEKRPIASMVKIMTLLLCFENLNQGKFSLDDSINISENASSMGGSQVFLGEGNEYKIGELLKSIVIASANDSCVAMAEFLSGSVESFVYEMNQKAKKLGMEDTVFVNCTGLPAPGQFSTANDVAKMFNQLIKNKQYFAYSQIWMDDFLHPDGRVTQIANTNKLLKQYKWCDGGKTGFTNEAKHCLASTAVRNDMRLISVIVGGNDSKSRFSDSKMLFDYGFSNYESKTYFNAGDIVEENIKISGGKADEICAVAKDKLVVFDKKGKISGELIVKINKNIKAPLKKGDVIGKALVKNGEIILAQTLLISPDNVEQAGFSDILNDILVAW